jgi:Tfp pilus assembly protein PilX
VSKHQTGFSVIEGLLIIIVVGFLGATGWMVYHNNHKTSLTSAGSTAALPAASPGTIQAVDNITTQAANGTSSIDGQYTNTDQSAASSSDTAASNLGGAYNESSF